jgi:hypothetical protein
LSEIQESASAEERVKPCINVLPVSGHFALEVSPDNFAIGFQPFEEFHEQWQVKFQDNQNIFSQMHLLHQPGYLACRGHGENFND